MGRAAIPVRNGRRARPAEKTEKRHVSRRAPETHMNLLERRSAPVEIIVSGSPTVRKDGSPMPDIQVLVSRCVRFAEERTPFRSGRRFRPP